MCIPSSLALCLLEWAFWVSQEQMAPRAALGLPVALPPLGSSRTLCFL